MWPIDVGSAATPGLYQGDTWRSRPIIVSESDEHGVPTGPVDVTGWTFRAQLKTGGVRHELTVTHSTEPAVGEAPAGETFVLSMPASVAREIRMSGVWDVEGIHVDGTVRTWLRGSLQHREDVTR